jgi:hypothetical protein
MSETKTIALSGIAVSKHRLRALRCAQRPPSHPSPLIFCHSTSTTRRPDVCPALKFSVSVVYVFTHLARAAHLGHGLQQCNFTKCPIFMGF